MTTDEAATLPAWHTPAPARQNRMPEWLHRGVLQLADGPQSDRVRHWLLRSYAVNVKAETAATAGRVILLGAGGETRARAGYLLPLWRPDLSTLIFDEGATFEESLDWPPAHLAVLAEKGAAARLHVLEVCGEASVDAAPPAEAEGGALAAAARFLDLERAELVLVLQGRRYDLAVTWLERAT